MSAERIINKTGGAKEQKKEQLSLMPPEALMEVSRIYSFGAEKYDKVHGHRANWRRGYDWHLSYDAAQRHMNAFWGGETYDPESGEQHLAHAVFHMLALMTFVHEFPEGDTRWKK